MACLAKLRADLQLLNELFPKTHSTFQVFNIFQQNYIQTFQIQSSSVDELSANFVNNNGLIIRVFASFNENYPQTPPIWFSESEDSIVTTVLEHLSGDNTENSISLQVHYLVTHLCRHYNFPAPIELHRLTVNINTLFSFNHSCHI